MKVFRTLLHTLSAAALIAIPAASQAAPATRKISLPGGNTIYRDILDDLNAEAAISLTLTRGAIPQIYSDAIRANGPAMSVLGQEMASLAERAKLETDKGVDCSAQEQALTDAEKRLLTAIALSNFGPGMQNAIGEARVLIQALIDKVKAAAEPPAEDPPVDDDIPEDDDRWTLRGGTDPGTTTGPVILAEADFDLVIEHFSSAATELDAIKVALPSNPFEKGSSAEALLSKINDLNRQIAASLGRNEATDDLLNGIKDALLELSRRVDRHIAMEPIFKFQAELDGFAEAGNGMFSSVNGKIDSIKALYTALAEGVTKAKLQVFPSNNLAGALATLNGLLTNTLAAAEAEAGAESGAASGSIPAELAAAEDLYERMKFKRPFEEKQKALYGQYEPLKELAIQYNELGTITGFLKIMSAEFGMLIHEKFKVQLTNIQQQALETVSRDLEVLAAEMAAAGAAEYVNPATPSQPEWPILNIGPECGEGQEGIGTRPIQPALLAATAQVRKAVRVQRKAKVAQAKCKKAKGKKCKAPVVKKPVAKPCKKDKKGKCRKPAVPATKYTAAFQKAGKEVKANQAYYLSESFKRAFGFYPRAAIRTFKRPG